MLIDERETVNIDSAGDVAVNTQGVGQWVAEIVVHGSGEDVRVLTGTPRVKVLEQLP